MDKFMIDKFMIDKYIKPADTVQIPNEVKIPNEVQIPNEIQIPNTVQIAENPQPIEREQTYYEPEIIDNELVLEEVQEEPSYRFTTITTIIGLIILVGYAIYYAVKTTYYKNNYLIKKNATSLDITLEELKSDIKNYLKETYEKFLDWKDNMKTKSNKYFFKRHLDNGAFKATKYKAKNLLTMFM